MTWTANISPEGIIGDDENKCGECKHVSGCQIIKMVHQVGALLTVVDTCSDGHIAGGTAYLKCAGYEVFPWREKTPQEGDKPE